MNINEKKENDSKEDKKQQLEKIYRNARKVLEIIKQNENELKKDGDKKQ